MTETQSDTALIRLRIASGDAHYEGNLVDGAHVLSLFGDAATELLIRHDGVEGLFRAYSEVEFLAPVLAGDFIEAEARIVRRGNTSREMVFEARKVISDKKVLDPPLVVARARGTCVARDI